MKKLFLYSTFIVLIIASTGLADDKDKKKKKDKDKDKDRDKEHIVYVESDGRRFDGNNDRYDDRYRDGRDDRREYRSYDRPRTRTIYVIERDRPVERVVYVDPEGRYYRVIDDRRVYVQNRYYESYPSKYYYPDGRRRVTINLPFF